jgi:hypothetical protein
MYATIQRCERGGASTDDLAREGHALATCLSKVPGFVACLLLEMPDGECASVSIFEDAASLAAANRLVAGWAAAEQPASPATAARPITGEVIAQRGL